MLDRGCNTRYELIWCHGRGDEQIDIGWQNIGICQRHGARFDGQLRGTNSRRTAESLAHAGSFGDPFVGCVHDRYEIMISHTMVWDSHSGSDNY